MAPNACPATGKSKDFSKKPCRRDARPAEDKTNVTASKTRGIDGGPMRQISAPTSVENTMADIAELSRAPAVHRHRWRAGIVGGRPGPDGRPTAARSYPLGCASDPEGGVVVTLIEEVPGIGITFEAADFDQAFARALVIGEDMADAVGHLADGVVISLIERDSLAELGLD
jgi:hypothetical protein